MKFSSPPPPVPAVVLASGGFLPPKSLKAAFFWRSSVSSEDIVRLTFFGLTNSCYCFNSFSSTSLSSSLDQNITSIAVEHDVPPRVDHVLEPLAPLFGHEILFLIFRHLELLDFVDQIIEVPGVKVQRWRG